MDASKPIESRTDKRRIAKNAVMLYLRMFLTMIVGFYTSRVVLNALGVDDYGTYGVVGGVVSMMGFLNASMSGATSRFMAFEMGLNDKERLSKTFSSAMIIHVIIALIVFVFAETVGLWFLTHKLVIPQDRMHAAHWVYQLSVASAMVGITQAPYGATTIAHEKMDIYAYFEILHVTLKLLIVYLLTIGDFDKLILYAVLVFAVGVLMRMIYRIYCIRHFEEARFHWVWDKKIVAPMLRFSAWNLYGSICVTVRQQGMTFLINIFFGVVFNAASSVASTLQGVIKGFAYNSTLAFRPQVIKNYAVGNIKELNNLLKSAMALTLFMTLLISLPVFVEIKYLMTLWLVNPPTMSIEFVCWLFISAFFAMMTGVVAIGIEATGYNKQVNVYTGTIYLLTIPVMYIFFRLGFGVMHAYYCIVAANVLIFISDLLILKYLLPSIQIRYHLTLLLKSAVIVAISVLPAYYIKQVMDESFLRLSMNVAIVISIFFTLSYWLVLDDLSRNALKSKMRALKESVFVS